MERAEEQLLTQNPEEFAVAEGSDPRHAAETAQISVPGTQRQMAVPTLKAEWHVRTQKRMPLDVKTWKLYIASYVFSYTLKYNLWPHQSRTGNKWAKNINIYPGFCLIPFKPVAKWCYLIPSLSTFSLTSHHLIPFQSIIWVMKSSFITQIGCVLWGSKLKQTMRNTAIFTQVQNIWLISQNSHIAFLSDEIYNFPKVHKPRAY